MKKWILLTTVIVSLAVNSGCASTNKQTDEDRERGKIQKTADQVGSSIDKTAHQAGKGIGKCGQQNWSGIGHCGKKDRMGFRKRLEEGKKLV